MQLNFTIQRKLLAFTLIALAFISGVGGAGYWAAAHLGTAKDEILLNARAIKDQVEADMMHDALRSDVLRAMLAATDNNMQVAAEIKQDVATHISKFETSIKDLEATQLNNKIEARLAGLRPDMDTYVRSAETFSQLAFTDLAAAKARLPEFSLAFKNLEDEMSALSELIEESSTHIESTASTDFARYAILFTIVGAWVILMAIAFFIARSIIRPLQEAVIVASAVAQGDLTQHIEVKTKDETGQLLHALQVMNEKLVGIISGVRNSTEAITTAAQQVSSGNNDLSQRTEQQASSLEETASSMEQLTSTVKQNADNARQANQLAASASDIAVRGGLAVNDVVQTMASISTSSKKIVDIISVIEGIAFQTNILALNAAVEAARAGEQGRGFAVVATEVRNLAQRSAAAAKEIKSLIGDSVGKVDVGSKQVDQAGVTMHEIVGAVKRVTDIMAEISAASAEQSAGIGQVNQAIIQMDEVTQQNAALVEQAAAAAESMQEQAQALYEAVSVFKLSGARGNARRQAAQSVSAAPAMVKAVTQNTKARQLSKSSDVEDGDWKEF